MTEPEMTPEQSREHHLSRIRGFAIDRDLTGEQIVMLFEAGLLAAGVLLPRLIKNQPPQESA